MTIFFGILLVTMMVHAGGQAEEPEVAEVSRVNNEPGLRLMVERAVETHPSIAAASASARAAGADVRAARWQRFPSFSVEGLLLDRPGNAMQAQVIIDQPLWTGGRISGSIIRANARQDAALAAYDEAVLTIALSTTQAYFDLHQLHERAANLSQSLDQHNHMVATMERRYAQGVSPLSDLELARARALQIEQQIFEARAQEGSASNRLRELVGDPFLLIGAAPQTPQAWPVFADENVVSNVLAYNPALKRLRFDAQAANAEARIAGAAILPQLSGQYSYSGNFGHRIGLVLKAQSDGGFSKFAAADAATERVRASELQISSGERQLRDQTFALLREYESATARLSGSQAASISARRVKESYMRQFTSGRRTWLDVMNAVREASSAERDVIDARISAHSSLARILLLSGQWTPLPPQGAQR